MGTATWSWSEKLLEKKRVLILLRGAWRSAEKWSSGAATTRARASRGGEVVQQLLPLSEHV